MDIFQRYVHASSVARDAAAVAALFTEDGVFEAPLAPAGHPLHQPLVGRAAIEAGIAVYQQWQPTVAGKIDPQRSALVRHETADPDTFIVELDVAFEDQPAMSLVRIFRLRDGLIAQLRDYFSEPAA